MERGKRKAKQKIRRGDINYKNERAPSLLSANVAESKNDSLGLCFIYFFPLLLFSDVLSALEKEKKGGQGNDARRTKASGGKSIVREIIDLLPFSGWPLFRLPNLIPWMGAGWRARVRLPP